MALPPQPHQPPAGLPWAPAMADRMKSSWACPDSRRRKEDGRTRERWGWLGSLPWAALIPCLHGCSAQSSFWEPQGSAVSVWSGGSLTLSLTVPAPLLALGPRWRGHITHTKWVVASASLFPEKKSKIKQKLLPPTLSHKYLLPVWVNVSALLVLQGPGFSRTRMQFTASDRPMRWINLSASHNLFS